MIGIYKITSPSKKVYIGQSVNIEKRVKSYKNINCKEQKKIYNSIKKYGFDKHIFEVVCECEVNELDVLERYYQDLYSVTSINGLNCILTSINNDKNYLKIQKRKAQKIINKEKKEIEKNKIKEYKNKSNQVRKIIDDIWKR